jgi:DNA-3-methyladenine glycosylase II
VEVVTEHQMRALVRKLVKADPAFQKIVANSPLCQISLKKYRRGHYETLVVSILSQQLSSKAADTIIARVKRAAGGYITPARISKLSDAQIRAAGASGAKVRTIREFTAAVESKKINFHKFAFLSNEEIARELTAIWGIGRWTVEMFLIFHLGRLDLWPVGDLAVRRGWEKIHKLKEKISEKELDKFSERFAGYQSVVAWYCWRATEGESSNW